MSWSGANTFALDAYQSIFVKEPVSVAGQGGLSVTTNHGGKDGYFGFQDKGQVTFASLSSALTINGATYTLVGDIATLAADVAANSAGNYALAKDYNAKADGTYSNSPIPTQFSGRNSGPISASYAEGSMQGGTGSEIGGLAGDNAEESTIAQSYSTAALKKIGHKNRDAGGLIGVDVSPAGSNTSDYWDISTSGVKSRKKGAGTPRKDPGITGLTTEQLQSGLPNGFDPKVWAEDPKINGGFPYLINNPPRK
ncbi:MAG TPA: hypothetical protein VHY79_04935 [Rhizomicrobium sp.]|nr:hypothetical protein [Rhizomicrobium sp.]